MNDQNGKFPLVGINESTLKSKQVLDASREKGLEIIHVRHEFESNDAPFFTPNSKGSEINQGIKPLDNELVILKHSPNSFVGTNLEQVLKSKGIDELIIVGAMTHMCIQGTSRAAGELGFKVIVPKDALATRDLEYDGETVSAKDVATVVFATLAFGYASVSTTNEVLKNM